MLISNYSSRNRGTVENTMGFKRWVREETQSRMRQLRRLWMTLEERFIFQGIPKTRGCKTYWDKLDLVRFVSLGFVVVVVVVCLVMIVKNKNCCTLFEIRMGV